MPTGWENTRNPGCADLTTLLMYHTLSACGEAKQIFLWFGQIEGCRLVFWEGVSMTFMGKVVAEYCLSYFFEDGWVGLGGLWLAGRLNLDGAFLLVAIAFATYHSSLPPPTHMLSVGGVWG